MSSAADPAPPAASESPPAKLRLGTAQFESVNAPAASTPPPVEVRAMLHDNLAHEKAAGLHELAPLPARRSRRRRDYWLALAVGNAVFALLMLLGGRNPFTLIYGLGGMALFSSGLTWVMWVVMDDH